MRRALALWVALACVGCDEREARSNPAPSTSAPSASASSSSATADDCSVTRDDTRGPRIASWNVRWFPDGDSDGPSDRATDVPALACAIARLDVDAIALQEVLLDARGERALGELTDRLDRHTGGRWTTRADACPRDRRQHLVWLVDETRATAQGGGPIDALNPAGGCRRHLRPGLSVRLRFADRLDLHAVNVHLDSGVEDRDYTHRAQSFAALPDAVAALRPEDPDVVVIGDLNTMGRRRPQVRAPDEIAELERAVQPLRRVTPDVACTEYYRGRGGVLDHALVSPSLHSRARLQVRGACAEVGCRLPRGETPHAVARISDHCPLVLSL